MQGPIPPPSRLSPHVRQTVSSVFCGRLCMGDVRVHLLVIEKVLTSYSVFASLHMCCDSWKILLHRNLQTKTVSSEAFRCTAVN